MNKKKCISAIVFTACFLLLSFIPLFTSLGWDAMQNIQFKDKYIEQVKAYMMFPVFTDQLKNLDGQQVKVEGYVIPYDKTGGKIALSANPYSACFFCGKAGPASVMAINLKEHGKKYRTDNYRYFIGKLRLNASDIKEFYYILEDANEVKE